MRKLLPPLGLGGDESMYLKARSKAVLWKLDPHKVSDMEIYCPKQTQREN